MLETGLHFLRPWWLLALLPVLPLGVLLARHAADHNRWQHVIDADLLAHLLEARRQRRRPLTWLAPSALILAVIALAGPTWERLPQPAFARSDGLVIALDLSLSMYAQDVAPSRFVRARHEVVDILAQRHDALTGLLVYAGTAHAVTPLTDDVRTIENLVAALEPGLMPVPGSDLGSALTLAREMFARAGLDHGRILVITDEITDVAAVSDAAVADFPVSVLGVGTAEGAPIPLAFAGRPGSHLTDASGVPVIARVDPDRLGYAASAGGGRFSMAETGAADTAALLADPLQRQLEVRAVSDSFDAWLDQGIWLLVLLAPLALLAFRRGVVVVLAGFLFVATPTDATALDWRDVALRRDQQGMQALADGDPARAAERFTSPDWKATASYRANRPGDASRLWAQDHSADGRYNLGNALAHQGQLEAAITAYEQALAVDASHADAAHNKSLLEQLRSQQSAQSQSGPQQPHEQQGEEGESAAPSDNQQNPSDTSSASEPTAGSESANEAGDSQATASTPPAATEAGDDRAQQTGDPTAAAPTPPTEAEASGETSAETAPANEENADGEQESAAQQAADARERSQATEQWLRRVPDDPGMLLRRKFLSQSQAARGRQFRKPGEQPW